MLALVSILCVCNSRAEIIWDSGHHAFSEGFEGEVWLLNDATADITGGEIGQLLCWDTSEVFVYEPGEIDLLRPNDSSTANVYSGTIGFLFALGSSNTNIYSASLDWLGAMDSSQVNLYVETYLLDPTGGNFGDGLLTGTWMNGETFSIDIAGDETIGHIHFVPEPSSMSIFVIGILMFRRSARTS